MKLSHLAVDPTRIEAGDWIDDIPDCGDLRIKTRGLGNADYRRMQQQKIAAVPRRERRAGIAPATMQAINTECLIATCLLGWENLTGPDGAPIVFSIETSRQYLADPRYEPLRDACFYAAGIVADEREGDREADAKN